MTGQQTETLADELRELVPYLFGTGSPQAAQKVNIAAAEIERLEVDYKRVRLQYTEMVTAVVEAQAERDRLRGELREILSKAGKSHIVTEIAERALAGEPAPLRPPGTEACGELVNGRPDQPCQREKGHDNPHIHVGPWREEQS